MILGVILDWLAPLLKSTRTGCTTEDKCTGRDPLALAMSVFAPVAIKFLVIALLAISADIWIAA